VNVYIISMAHNMKLEVIAEGVEKGVEKGVET
jgi:sensor c-di-GMP phosphodiesterase-like protein